MGSWHIDACRGTRVHREARLHLESELAAFTRHVTCDIGGAVFLAQAVTEPPAAAAIVLRGTS
jgi:hypothetical protein